MTQAALMRTTHRGMTYEWRHNAMVSGLPSLRYNTFYDLCAYNGRTADPYTTAYYRVYIEYSPAQCKAWIRSNDPGKRLTPEPPEFDTPEQAMAWYFAIIKME